MFVESLGASALNAVLVRQCEVFSLFEVAFKISIYYQFFKLEDERQS